MGFVVYGECPDYKGYCRRKNMSKKKNVSATPSYKLWSRLLRIDRGLDAYLEGVKLCEEWKEYSNFEKWYDENFYEVNGEKMQFSYKFFDIYNKTYAPNTCCFLPESLNATLCKLGNSDSEKGLSDVWKSILGKKFLDTAEKYKNELPQCILERLINFEKEVANGKMG